MQRGISVAVEYAEWKLVRGALWLWAKKRDVQVYGLENVDMNRSGLFAGKHSRDEDLPLTIHALPRRTVIFATERIFANPMASYVLRAAGVVPIYVAWREKPSRLPPIDVQAFRVFYRTLESGGWVAYAPEAKQVPYAVGEVIYPQLLMKAAELGHPTYLTGANYGKSGIEVRIERYCAGGKPAEQVAQEVKVAFARLSGLEQKVEANDSGAAASLRK